MALWQSRKTACPSLRCAAALAAAVLVALILVLPAPCPTAQAPPAGLEELDRLGDEHMLLAVRKLIQGGRTDSALRALDFWFAREDRNTDFDWEAAVLRETCRRTAPAARPRSNHRPRMEAVQVFVFSSPGPDELDAELEAMQAAGADTVIVRAFQNQGDRPLFRGTATCGPGVYFRTGSAPTAADLLPAVLAKAHARGMRVLAWMTTRNSDWLIQEHPEWLEYRYDFALGRSLPSRSLSIFQEGVRLRLVQLFRDLAATGVDGILFQDDMVMRYNEGFSAAATGLFLRQEGLGAHPGDLFTAPSGPGASPGPGPLFVRWCRWKSAALTGFLEELARGAKEVNPDLVVAVNVYYETILRPDRGLAWYAQDAAALAAGPADYLAVMSYHRQMKKELRLGEEELRGLLEDSAKVARGLDLEEPRIIFKVQTVDWERSEPIPEREWGAVMELFRKAGNFSLARLKG